MHFGRAPADLSVDMTLPKEVVQRLETEDNLCGVPESRQVFGYASFDPSSDTPLASRNPPPFSHLSQQERLMAQKQVGLSVPLPMMKYRERVHLQYWDVFTATATRGALYTVPTIAQLLFAYGNG